MTANKERLYWHSNKEWYKINKETGKFELTETAPQQAVESFEKWCNCIDNEKEKE